VDCDNFGVVEILDLARTETGHVEPAEVIAALEKTVVDANAFIAPAVYIAGLQLCAGDDAWPKSTVRRCTQLVTQVVHIAAKPRNVLTEVDLVSTRGFQIVVRPVHGERIAQRRSQPATLLVADRRTEEGTRRAVADAAAAEQSFIDLKVILAKIVS